MMKLSSGRFKNETNQLVDDYNASIKFDYQLATFDIQGSLAHVKMLGKCGILSQEIVNSISEGLHKIYHKLEKDEIEFDIADEDIHMNIECMLNKLIGDEAGNLHTGRSRNDQVALDLHLYLRHHILKIINQLYEINHVIIKLAEDNIDVIMPGYTHLQRAEPIRFSHHIMAYFHMFHRDIERLMDSFKRVNISPLGAGALAGSGVAVDRDFVAQHLNMDGIYENSLDAVSDRDFVAQFLFNASLIMMHFSKLSEEIILWSSHEFSFIELADEFCTGSSMMPQKKNPDVAELARGKTGRVYGALMGLLTVLKGLPLAYNKDLQEDKEGLFDTVETLSKTLCVYKLMLGSMRLNTASMANAVANDYSNATQLANYMVSKGIPFRQSHKITGEIVMHCIDTHCLLHDLTLETFQAFCDLIDEGIYSFISTESVIEAHQATGGTAKDAVLCQIKNAQRALQVTSQWLEEK